MLRITQLLCLTATCSAALLAPVGLHSAAARCTAPRCAAVIVAKAELTVCTGSVCSKHGTKEVQAAARKSGLAVKTTSKCLKGCGKGVNVTGKGIGKRMLKGCSDPAKAQAATDHIAKKLGL